MARKYVRAKPLKTVECKCLNCGESFNQYPSRIKKGEGKFCSKACFYAWRVGKSWPHKGSKWSEKKKELWSQKFSGSGNPMYGVRLLGDKNPMWKGGKNRTERQKLRGQLEYKNWRKAVFERDDYTCQFCKKRGVHLEADHIKPWVSYPELRYSIKNGRTLCIDCHRATDTWGGRVFNSVKSRG